ncbi:MAG: hypothetical protein P8101_01320 [Candidatus Thiodiazotropha sp.]|jgi:hypothetical protein
MEWEKSGNSVVHRSGFTLSVDHGSFSSPFEINIRHSEELTPADLAGMIRSALAYGRECEQQARTRDPEDASSLRQPKIVIRKKRRIGSV